MEFLKVLLEKEKGIKKELRVDIAISSIKGSLVAELLEQSTACGKSSAMVVWENGKLPEADPGWKDWKPSAGDPGWAVIDKIMGGQELPVWDEAQKKFSPPWTEETIELANKIIANTQEELKKSSAEHRAERQANRQEQATTGQTRRKNLGWLERTCIWDRACASRAVSSIVIKLPGMTFDERKDQQGVDRTSAAANVQRALKVSACAPDMMQYALLDTVCSKVDKEVSTGVVATKAHGLFNARFPA